MSDHHVPKIYNRELAVKLLEIAVRHLKQTGDSVMRASEENIAVDVTIHEAKTLIYPDGSTVEYAIE